MFKKKKKTNETLEIENNLDKKEVEDTNSSLKEDKIIEDTKEDKVIEDSKKKKEKVYKTKTPISETKVGKTFNLHKFIIKIIATIILIVFAILLFIYQDAAIFAVLLITGGTSLFGALIRVFFVFRKDKTKGTKIISAIELSIHGLFGAFLVIGAFLYKNAVSTADFINASNAIGFDKNTYLKEHNYLAYFVQCYYPYFLAGILYIRGVAYFFHTVLGKVKTHTFTFWLHIFALTLAVVIAALASQIDTSKIVITLGVIACICALVIGGEAVVGYINFNNNKKAIKSKEKEDEESLGDIDTNILPKNESSSDSLVV